MSPTANIMRDRAKAIKKVEIAIDKLVDVKDLGFSNDTVERSLDSLNALLNRLRDLNSGYTS